MRTKSEASNTPNLAFIIISDKNHYSKCFCLILLSNIVVQKHMLMHNNQNIRMRVAVREVLLLFIAVISIMGYSLDTHPFFSISYLFEQDSYVFLVVKGCIDLQNATFINSNKYFFFNLVKRSLYFGS